eukprot:gene12055-2646_t
MAGAEIDEDQLEDMKDCYSIFDKKGDMKVESDRLVDVLRSLGLNPLTEDVEKCLEESKLKGQRVDFETFFGIYKFILNKPTVGSYEDMVEGLKTLDRDASGLIYAAEIRHILSKVADRMTEDQLNHTVGPFENAEGLVAYETLIKSVMAA